MNDHKKQMRLLGLVCLVICGVFLLAGCFSSGEKPTEPTDTTVETTTESEETTLPEETTEPETQQTTEETTEPPTEKPDKPSTNTGNGTGGSYTPQVTEPVEEETEPETTEPEVTVPAPGSQENPYYESIPDAGSFTTVKIPAEGAVCYAVRTSGAFLQILSEEVAVIYDGKTCEPQDDGVKLSLPGDEASAKILLQIANHGAQEQVFAVEILEKAGGASNPIALTDISRVPVKLKQGNTSGIYYTWTADKTGILTIGLESIQPVDGKADIAVTVGYQTYQLSESGNGILQIPVTEQDEVMLHVTAQSDADADTELTIVGQIATADIVEYPGFEAKVEAYSIGYYEGYNLNGTIFSLTAENVAVTHNGVTYLPQNGQIVFPVTAENRMPAQFIVENHGAEDAVYMVSLQYPVGNAMNPATMALGASYIQQSAGAEPFCFRYTAVKAGELVLTFAENASWYYTVDNLTQQSYGDEQYSDSAESTNIARISVEAGDVIQLRVNTYDPQQPWNAPAGRVDFTATLITGPVEISDLSQPFETVLLAGETVRYTGNLQGMQLTLENAQYATLCYNGAYYEAGEDGVLNVTFLDSAVLEELEFTLLNRSVSDWNCTMKFTAVVGGPKAPDQLVLGSSSVESTEGACGYWFCYTAAKNGELVLRFDPDKTWSYAINGGQVCYSDGQPQINETAITVMTGDKVLIWVNTYDPAKPETAPAGTVPFHASMVSDPVELDLTQVNAVELLAQETAQFTGDLRNAIVTFMNAENLTLVYNDNTYTAEDGILRVAFSQPDSNGQWRFTLTNNGAEDLQCPMRVSGTEGSRFNPKTMVLGSNTAQQAEGAVDYCFRYTASKTGKLVLRFDAASNWCYSINDGEKQYSDAESPASDVEIAVTEGQQVTVAVNSYDPAAPDTVPAADVTFRAWLISDPVTVSDPRQPFTADLLAGETAQYTGCFKDAVVAITNGENIIAYYGENVYPADETGRITFAFDGDLWAFSLENSSNADISCTLTFTGDPGTWLNPAVMPLGKNTVTQQENGDPYYWNYHVTKNGTLLLTFNTPAAWSYGVNDGDKRSGVAAMGEIVEIPAENGDDIAILICTYDQEAPETVPAGTVEFEATLLTDLITVTDPEQPLLTEMLAGETQQVTGAIAGGKFTVENAEFVTVFCNGVVYTADEGGVITFTVPQAEGDTLPVLLVHNGAAQDATYILIFGEEKGTQSNPAVLAVGSNTAVCKAGSEGYYFTFTAQRDCQIRLTFDQNSQWAFEWAYGSGNSDKASSSWKFRSNKILAGETVTVLIKTYDPENPTVLPEGTVTFTMDIPVYY